MIENPLRLVQTEVIGCLMAKPGLFESSFIDSQDFDPAVDDRHSHIFSMVKEMYEEKGFVDTTLLYYQHKDAINEMGGLEFLGHFKDYGYNQSSFNSYQKTLREERIKREGVILAGRIQRGEIESAAEITAEAERISAIPTGVDGEGLKRLSDWAVGHSEIISNREGPDSKPGAKTCSAQYDDITGGHRKADLIVVGGRPSMGKTAWSVTDSSSVALNGRPVAYMSAEMAGTPMLERYICVLAGIEIKKVMNGLMTLDDWNRYGKAIDILIDLPLYMDDKAGMTVEHIVRETKKLHKKHPDLVLYVDYLQYIRSERKFGSNQERVSHVSYTLKQLAKELDIPVIALVQLGREVEKRQDKRPMMSDIRDSGSIEQDGDVIAFLHRPEYYDADTDKKGIAEIIVAKGRSVGTGMFEMMFDRLTGRFIDLTPEIKQEMESRRNVNNAGRRSQ